MQTLGLIKVNELYGHCKARQKKMSYYQDGISIALRLNWPNFRQAFSKPWPPFFRAFILENM